MHGEVHIVEIKPAQLLLRCYAERVDNQWQAFCLDLTLAAQGDSFEQARGKLRAMIVEYVTDAIVGEDREFADQLLSRKAPLGEWAKYYGMAMLTRLHAARSNLWRLFHESLPLVPPTAALRSA